VNDIHRTAVIFTRSNFLDEPALSQLLRRCCAAADAVAAPVLASASVEARRVSHAVELEQLGMRDAAVGELAGTPRDRPPVEAFGAVIDR